MSLAEPTLTADYEALRRFLQCRVGCPVEAQDLTQEVFARLLRAKNRAEVKRPRGLLFQIARNLLIDRWRRSADATLDPLEKRAEEEAVTFLDPARHAESRDELRLVQEAIAKLPERCREVFILNRFGDLSYADISNRLGISQSTVEKHMIRALLACRAALAVDRT